MNKIQEMASFVAVVESGSFVAAAELTEQSKAAVSRHVADLEQRLGVRLLHRTTRRLSLTNEGQAFLARAKEVLTALDEAEAEISNHAGEASGTLRVNAPLSFGILHLAPLWGRFIAQNPKVDLDVSLADRFVDLVEEGFDLAVRITQNPASTTLVSRKLASTQLVLCAAPAYLACKGTPTHTQQLSDHHLLAYSLSASRNEWTFVHQSEKITVPIRPCFSANNGDTCKAAALDGQGIILAPDFMVYRELQSGELVELMPSFRAAEIGIYAVYPTRKHLALKVRRMIDFLVVAFEKPVWGKT